MNVMQSSTGKGPSLTMIGTGMLTLAVIVLGICGEDKEARELQEKAPEILEALAMVAGGFGTMLAAWGKWRSNRKLEEAMRCELMGQQQFIREQYELHMNGSKTDE